MAEVFAEGNFDLVFNTHQGFLLDTQSWKRLDHRHRWRAPLSAQHLFLRGCLKSPDSVNFGDYPHSIHLRNTWAESYVRPVSVEISGLFKHPLRQDI